MSSIFRLHEEIIVDKAYLFIARGFAHDKGNISFFGRIDFYDTLDTEQNIKIVLNRKTAAMLGHFVIIAIALKAVKNYYTVLNVDKAVVYCFVLTCKVVCKKAVFGIIELYIRTCFIYCHYADKAFVYFAECWVSRKQVDISADCGNRLTGFFKVNIDIFRSVTMGDIPAENERARSIIAVPADLDLLTVGLVNDMYIESDNDSETYAQVATQEQMDAF